MYAVIFKATTKQLDDEYSQTSARMRELAKSKYGCEEFISAQEGDQEIAISYWHSEQDIQAWKDDPEHRRAQALGPRAARSGTLRGRVGRSDLSRELRLPRRWFGALCTGGSRQ